MNHEKYMRMEDAINKVTTQKEQQLLTVSAAFTIKLQPTISIEVLDRTNDLALA